MKAICLMLKLENSTHSWRAVIELQSSLIGRIKCVAQAATWTSDEKFSQQFFFFCKTIVSQLSVRRTLKLF